MHKFCEVFNAFVISIELGFTKGYITFFTDVSGGGDGGEVAGSLSNNVGQIG